MKKVLEKKFKKTWTKETKINEKLRNIQEDSKKREKSWGTTSKKIKEILTYE